MNAYVAKYAEFQSSFSEAAEPANLKPSLSAIVTCKRRQDRFKKLIHSFERKDILERRMSGFGGEVGELNEISGEILEAQKDIKKAKECTKVAYEEQEDRKGPIGRALFAKAFRKDKHG